MTAMDEARQRERIRHLARRVSAAATSKDMKARRKRWSDVHMLREPDRVPVFCNPGASRDEILRLTKDLVCMDPAYREVEKDLQYLLFCVELNDDQIVDNAWRVKQVFRTESSDTEIHGTGVVGEDQDLWGVSARRLHGSQPAGYEGVSEGTEKGATTVDPPIKSKSDIDRLQLPSFYFDEAETRRRVEWYEEIFGGILPVKEWTQIPSKYQSAKIVSELIGLQNMMLYMATDPPFVHELMDFVSRGCLHCMKQIEEMGVLTPRNFRTQHYSESLKTSPPDEPYRLSDTWGRLESQQFEGVSPNMWKEFCLDYQRPILEEFGYVSYGCCEDLTRKMDDVLAIPNLRIFVNGPWTDLQTTVEKAGDAYSIEWRQNPTDVIFAPDLDDVRTHLENGLKMTQGCYRGIVLQEIAEVNDNPERLAEWVRLAKEVSEKHS